MRSGTRSGSGTVGRGSCRYRRRSGRTPRRSRQQRSIGLGDWTTKPRTIKTPYGPIYYGGACRDNYRNFVRYDAEPKGSGLILVLQAPAMRAFKAAQVRFAKRSGWTRQRIAKHPDGRPIILLPGTNRTCATQAALYRSDSDRYADPKYTGHTRGLAIDISQAQGSLSTINTCLRQEGWEFARSDEAWHASYFVSI